MDLEALAVLTGRTVKSLQRLAERGVITHECREQRWPYRKLYSLADVRPILHAEDVVLERAFHRERRRWVEESKWPYRD